MPRTFQVIDDKVAEADFFLECLEIVDLEFLHARYYFSAFVGSARSITFAMQASMTGVNGFDAWYSKKQEILRADPLAKFFHLARTENQHIGEIHLKGGSCASKGKRARYYFDTVLGSRKHLPDLDVAAACTLYLKLLVGIVFDCYSDFGPEMDPDQHYTVENFRRCGIKIEDALLKFGYTKEWIASAPHGTDRDWMRILRREAGSSDIDPYFEKYLGKIRSLPEDS